MEFTGEVSIKENGNGQEGKEAIRAA